MHGLCPHTVAALLARILHTSYLPAPLTPPGCANANLSLTQASTGHPPWPGLYRLTPYTYTKSGIESSARGRQMRRVLAAGCGRWQQDQGEKEQAATRRHRDRCPSSGAEDAFHKLDEYLP